MARQCNDCMHYNKRYDEEWQRYDDIKVIGSDEPKFHHCPMYDSHIPTGIYYDNEPCEFYTKK